MIKPQILLHDNTILKTMEPGVFFWDLRFVKIMRILNTNYTD